MKVHFCSVVSALALAGMFAWNCGAAVKVETTKVSPRVAEVVKLVESGVSEDVVLAYVTNAPATKPNADEIIYLHEAGISKAVIMALVSKNGNGNGTATVAPAVAAGSARVLSRPVYEQPASAAPSVVYVPPPAVYGGPGYYDYSYYRGYDTWPAVSLGFSFGHHFGHHGHHGHHGLGNIFGHHGLGHIFGHGGHHGGHHSSGHHGGGHHWSGHRGGHHGGGHQWGHGGHGGHSGHRGGGIHFTGHSGRRH